MGSDLAKSLTSRTIHAALPQSCRLEGPFRSRFGNCKWWATPRSLSRASPASDVSKFWRRRVSFDQVHKVTRERAVLEVR